MPDEEWEALGPDERGRAEETHPQFHLKVLLDRIGVARGEVQLWPSSGRAASPAVRTRAIAHAMTAADFSDKWNALKPAERRLTGIRAAELPDPAAEAQAIALAIREALETPGRTAALVTPDRLLAQRVSALLGRWGIEADDSAGRALSQLAPGTLLLAIASAAAERPRAGAAAGPAQASAGRRGRARRGASGWTMSACSTSHCAVRARRRAWRASTRISRTRRVAERAWRRIRPQPWATRCLDVRGVAHATWRRPLPLRRRQLAGDRAWSGRRAERPRNSSRRVQARHDLRAPADAVRDAVPILRQLLDGVRIRPPYGGHPRVFIWGLLEARLQQADLMILGGLNEGVWPALPAPDPWLAPKIRANLGLPGLEFRVGLSAHDFASALGAPQVLITRARRDSRSPTVASRLWLRLQAMTGGLAHDTRLERLALSAGRSGRAEARGPARTEASARAAADEDLGHVGRPAEGRSVRILCAGRFSACDGSTRSTPIIAPHGRAPRFTRCSKNGCARTIATRTSWSPRARALLASETIHPMLRALWQPRLMEAIRWIEEQESDEPGRGPPSDRGREEGRGEHRWRDCCTARPTASTACEVGGLAIVDYKTGKAPAQKAVEAGFSLQLGLLGLIAEAGGFEGISGRSRAHEYWSLSKYGDQFGKCVRPDKKMGPDEFLEHARRNFAEAARKWLTGDEAFTAKLNPAYAPYGDYDQLMRLEEWYGRR